MTDLRKAVKNYFAVWDRCGGDESVAADEFAQGRQAMRAALAATSAEADDVSRYIANANAQSAEISASETEFMVELKRRAATPAVGGEQATDILPAELRGSMAEFLGSLTGLVPPSDNDKESIPPEMRPAFEKMIGRLTEAAKRYAAQAASPLRGRELGTHSIFRIIGGRAKSSEDAWAIANELFEALSASPPEQPQRNLGVASDSDRTTTVPDRTTDATPRNDPQEPTSRDSRERPAPPEQPAAPDKETFK